MKYEQLVGPSVGLSLVGGSFASSEYLHEIGAKSLARLPEGSTFHTFGFAGGINLAFLPIPIFDRHEVRRLAGFNKAIAHRHDGRPAISVGHSFGATLARRASRENPSVVKAIVELAPPIGTPFEDLQDLPYGVESHQVRPTLDINPPQLFQSGSRPTTSRNILGLGGHIGTFIAGDGVEAAVAAVVEAYSGRIKEETVYLATLRP